MIAGKACDSTPEECLLGGGGAKDGSERAKPELTLRQDRDPTSGDRL